MTDDREKNKVKSNDSTSLPPDEETLHTTDPQENMEGPVSSTMQKIGEGFESHESKQEADEKREENM